jgi:hypothetical protein
VLRSRPVLRDALLRQGRAVARLDTNAVLGGLALLVALYAVVAPFVVTRYPPMTDLPFHAAQTATLRHYWDPSFHFHEQFELHPLAVPYLSMYALGAVLMLVFPAVIAVKMAAAVMVGLVPAGLAVMFHGMKKSPLLGLLGLGLCWCNLTHWGFLNFVGALGLFAMSIGFTLLLVDSPSPRRQWALAITLVALFFTHIFRYPFALCAVVGTVVVLYPATRRWRPVLAPLAPALFLMGLWLVVRPKVLVGETGQLAIHKERLAELPGLLTGAFFDPAERKAFDGFFKIALAVAVVSVVAAVVAAALRRPRETSPWWDAGVTVVPLSCALVFLGLFLVLPMQMGVWWYVYPREATAAAVIALGAFPDLPRSAWLRAPLAAALAFGGVLVARVVVDNYAKFEPVTQDFAAIVKEIPRAPKLMYLVFDHGGSTRTSTPFIHLPAYVQAEQGGWLGFHFAVWGASPIVYRPRDQAGAVVPPPVPLRWEWTPQLFDVKRHGAFFDWFLVRGGGSPDRLFAADPAVERIDHIGTWWLYRRRAAQDPGAPAVAAPVTTAPHP